MASRSESVNSPPNDEGKKISIFLYWLLLIQLGITVAGVLYTISIPISESERMIKLTEWTPLLNGCACAVVATAISASSLSPRVDSFWFLVGGAIAMATSPIALGQLIPNSETWIGVGMFCLKFGIFGLGGTILGLVVGTCIRLGHL